MIILKYAADIKVQVDKARGSVGFVPTMGALHEGHISLLKKAKETCDLAIASIFINPTQFNNAEDFKKYPVTIENDIYLLEKNGCDILYLPDVTDIYPGGIAPTEHFELGYLETVLEGKYRPGHFQGVCQVVNRLLEIVQPTHLFLGQKDYQQCLVIKKLICDKKIDLELIICPTLRNKNGLAMSSRNLRLTEEEKERASTIYQTIKEMMDNIRPGDLSSLKKNALDRLVMKNIRPDYIEIASADDLRLINEWNGTEKVVVLAAAYVGDVRLIDNIVQTA